MSSNRDAQVLIAGGGVAALEALLALRAQAAGLIDVSLLAPDPAFLYRPLAVVEPFAPHSVAEVPLAEVAAEQAARLVPDALVRVDPDLRVATTRGGRDLLFDELVVAVGAGERPTLPGTTRFGDPREAGAVAAILARVREGSVRRLAFVVPPGVGWTLPLYELALLFSAERSHDGRRPELLLVTAEETPLAVFGPDTAGAVADLLAARGVVVRTASAVESVEPGWLWIELEGAVPIDAVIAQPALGGPALDGLPRDADGFLPIDGHARVQDLEHVYAAGDAVAWPLKQGGLAAQHADAAAAHIAAKLGAEVDPVPLDPVLRGVLLTGMAGSPPRFLRTHLGDAGAGRVSTDALWWPPAKIAAPHLAPYLADRLLERRG